MMIIAMSRIRDFGLWVFEVDGWEEEKGRRELGVGSWGLGVGL